MGDVILKKNLSILFAPNHKLEKRPPLGVRAGSKGNP